MRALLSHPCIYSLFQYVMGAYKFRNIFVSQFIRPFSGMYILDIGCGPADIRAHLPEVNYWGFDISEAYIAKARKTFDKQGHFRCDEIRSDTLNGLPKFDVALAIGLLHHLDDKAALDILYLMYQALKPGGRVLTADPCFEMSQNPIARFLINNDRGQNVREQSGYEKLARRVFESARSETRHQKWIPYTHCILECTKN